MKILMLTPYLPYPPASGGQIRTFNLLKYLHRNHEITLVSLYKSENEKQYADYLKSYCSRIFVCKRAEKPWQRNIILKTIFSSKPLLIVRNFSAEAEAVLKKLLDREKFDVIHAETFYVMPHLPKTKIPILLVEQTIEYQVYQHFVNRLFFMIRPLLLLDVLKLKFWEKYYWKKAGIVATVSQTDRKMIKKDEPGINPVIIPNGAGDEMFVRNLSTKVLKENVFLFQGNFSWLQNREAANYLADKLFPLLTKVLPNCKIVIAGQETKRINGFIPAQITLIEIKPDNTEMVKTIYQKAALFIAPIFGPGGTRLKILAAMASGLPVISTKTGIEGLDVKNNNDVLIADNPQQFVDKIKLILKNKDLYDKIRKNAFILVKKKYSWQSISKQLEVVYQSL